MMGLNVKSDRHQTAEVLLTPARAATLQPAWVFDANRNSHTTNSEITGYPTVADGCVFVGTSTGNAPDGQHLPGWIFAMNSDDGEMVWRYRTEGAVYSTLAVDDGVVYAFVSVVGAPYVLALDQATGARLWQTPVDFQFGSDAVSSPIPYDGMIWVGVSGTNAEVNEPNRLGFEGSSVILAARDGIEAPRFDPIDAPTSSGTRTYKAGQIIRKVYTIPVSEWADGHAGGAQWGTVAIDPDTGYGYVGTGNPFNYDAEYGTTNAVLKIDFDRSRTSFGQIVDSYKGDIEELVQEGAGVVPCDQLEALALANSGIECARLDLDFGAVPNIVTDASGRKLVVVGQKSGGVHFIDADTMERVNLVRLGVPSAVGGMVGSAATDGHTVFGSHSLGGYLYGVTTEAEPRWVSPVADGIHWGPPVSLAHGVIYIVDLKGFLDAYDAATGLPLLHRPMALPGVSPGGLTGDPATLTNPMFSWGGTTIARHTVFASVGVGLSQVDQSLHMPNGFVIAYRPVG